MRSQSKQEKMIRQKNVCFLHRTKILTENRGLLDEVALYLLQKETITGEEFMNIVNAK